MADIHRDFYSNIFSKEAKPIKCLSPLNLTDQHKIRIGACAWSFQDWDGSFYPSDLPESQWLEFYANYFPAVEVDSTFYAAPAEATLRRWIEITPPAFRFACKLPREITHSYQLRDCMAELSSFLRAIELLAPKLQVILIQLPPSFAPKHGNAALRKFLGQLPQDFRFAIEFRHVGWHRPSIIRLLEKHRICWVWADTTPLNERNLARSNSCHARRIFSICVSSVTMRRNITSMASGFI